MTNTSLHRTNLNLRAEDVAWLTHTYGYGWTEQARELLHQRIEQIKDARQINPDQFPQPPETPFDE